jgi:hypothetical protein
MILRNDRELADTREKLHILEQSYEAARNDHDEDEQVRELTMESLKRFIDQLKEEIARYETRLPAR